VVGSAGAGKSVLLSSWAAARTAGLTCWLSCDKADADPVRFWTGFIEATRALAPGFGADAADLLAIDKAMSADVTASIADDATKLPAGAAIIVDDFHVAAAAVSGDMTDFVERWPAGAAQLVLATRVDPPLRLHRLRMSGELCELRDRDLYFSLRECRDLLTNFGVGVAAGDLALLHHRSEGWAAALQMAALSLRATTDPVRAVRAREWAEASDAELVTEFLIGGITRADVAEDLGLVWESADPTSMLLPPLPNLLFQRDPSCWIFNGVTLNPMTKPARKPETMIMEAVYRFHPMFAGEEFPIWLGGAGQDWGRAHVEGGDVQPIGNGTI
jgi:Arginine deiminase